MSMSEVECSVCGRPFLKENKSINEARKRGYNLYCSKVCKVEASKNSVEVPCANCGNAVETKPWIINKSKSGNVYCSRSCASAANNRMYKWGGLAYEEALERAGHKCEVCGYSNENFLQFFHKDGDRFNNGRNNIVVVCPNHLAEMEHEAMFEFENGTL
jgi:hypothetical protein